MTVSDHAADEVFNSLNAFDEIAIAKAFDADVYVLRNKPFAFLRALAFTHFRREGQHDKEARETAFLLTIGDLGEFFVKNDPEPGDDLEGDEDPGEAQPG